MPYFITVTCMWSHDSLLLDYLTLHSVSNYFIYFFILQLKYPAEVLLCNCTSVASIYLELLFCSCPSVLLCYSAAILIQNQISLKVLFTRVNVFKLSTIFYLFLLIYLFFIALIGFKPLYFYIFFLISLFQTTDKNMCVLLL